jgi:hypothetical protein
LSTNRPNPYTFPGIFRSLAAGLPAYETRQCTGAPSPTLVADPSLISPDLQANIQKYFFGPLTAGGQVASPPCKQQAKFPFGGVVTQYPHVNASTGPVARALARAAAKTR